MDSICFTCVEGVIYYILILRYSVDTSHIANDFCVSSFFNCSLMHDPKNLHMPCMCLAMCVECGRTYCSICAVSCDGVCMPKYVCVCTSVCACTLNTCVYVYVCLCMCSRVTCMYMRQWPQCGVHIHCAS